MSELATPIALFRAVWDRAIQTAPPPPADPAAVALATATLAGRPSVRMVLLRGFDEDGFVFFTNYGSRKALEVETNPQAALCFYWHWIEQQVRVEGRVIRATREESDRYFQSRPRGSQIGAWASQQSQPLASREELDARFAAVARQYGDGPIPRPEFWGGYRLVPSSLEFWTAGTYRLHERRLFTRTRDGWQEQLLYP